MNVKIGYTNPTDRIADLLVKTVASHFKPDDAARTINTAGDVLHKGIERLAYQVARQGLSPADFDRLEGCDALAAIASAITTMKKKGVHFASLPAEWKHVVNAAKRLADRRLREAQR